MEVDPPYWSSLFSVLSSNLAYSAQSVLPRVKTRASPASTKSSIPLKIAVVPEIEDSLKARFNLVSLCQPLLSRLWITSSTITWSPNIDTRAPFDSDRNYTSSTHWPLLFWTNTYADGNPMRE